MCRSMRAFGVTYLTDEHASCHGEPGAGREVRGDHDAQAGLREGQLVGVEDEELVHHDDRGSLLTVGLAWENGFVQRLFRKVRFTRLPRPLRTFVEEHHGGVAGGGVLPHLVVPVDLQAGTAGLDAPELARHKHQDLGVEPATVQTLLAHAHVHIKHTNTTD